MNELPIAEKKVALVTIAILEAQRRIDKVK